MLVFQNRGSERHILKLLIYSLADHELIRSVWLNNLPMAELALKQGARVNTPQHENTPLYEAATRGHLTLVKLLLYHGA